MGSINCPEVSRKATSMRFCHIIWFAILLTSRFSLKQEAWRDTAIFSNSAIRCALLPCLMGQRIRSLVYAPRTTLRPGVSFCAAFNLIQIALVGLRTQQLLESFGARSMRGITTQLQAPSLPSWTRSSFLQIGRVNLPNVLPTIGRSLL